MIQKLLVILFAFVANILIQWYGNFTGKLPTKGTYLGFSFDSLFVRALITQFEYLWILIIINVLFTMMFGLGFATFKNFLSLAIIWLAMGPVSALLFNGIILKEQINYIAYIGIFFVILGATMVVAQKEILSLLSR